MPALLLSLCPAFGTDIDVSHSSSAIEGDVFAISLPQLRISLDAGPLAIGELDRRGLVRTLSELHDGPFDLTLRAVPFHKEGERSGAVVSVGPLSVGASLNDRALAAASLSYEHFSAAVLYAFPGAGDDTFMEDRKDSEGQGVMFIGTSFSFSIFSAGGIASFSPHLGFDGFLTLSASYGRYSLSLSAGSPPVLYEDSPRYMYGISATLGEEGFLSELSLRIGNAPVFSNEYLEYDADIKSRLKLYDFTIYSSMEYSFSRRGNSSKADRFTVEAYGLKLGFDSEYGIVAVYDAGPVEFGYDEGHAYAVLETDILGEHSRLRLRLSSESIIDVSISLDL